MDRRSPRIARACLRSLALQLTAPNNNRPPSIFTDVPGRVDKLLLQLAHTLRHPDDAPYASPTRLPGKTHKVVGDPEKQVRQGTHRIRPPRLDPASLQDGVDLDSERRSPAGPNSRQAPPAWGPIADNLRTRFNEWLGNRHYVNTGRSRDSPANIQCTDFGRHAADSQTTFQQERVESESAMSTQHVPPNAHGRGTAEDYALHHSLGVGKYAD